MPENSVVLPTSVPYADRPTSDPIVQQALEACPWRTTDHWPPETRGENYCTWCDGYVTGTLATMDKVREAFIKAAEDEGLVVRK